jgi:invasion protein IalB
MGDAAYGAPAEEKAEPEASAEEKQRADAQGAGEQLRIRSERFEDWFYRCVKADGEDGKAAKRCEVVQIAQTKHEGRTINLLTISFSESQESKSKKNDTVITVLTPQNVYLPDGLKLGVDKNEKMILEFRNCNNAGCWAQHLLTTKMLKSFEKGQFGYGHIQLINGQNINIKFSLKGLGAALSAMKSGKLPDPS